MFSKKIIEREVDGKPYLIRYRIFDCRWFKIRIHHILLSDYDCLHDHPWNFLSIILKGGYWEKTTIKEYCRIRGLMIKSEALDKIESKRFYKPGSFLYRPAEYKHALDIPKGKTCWTLVVMFRRRREWGFWTPTGWKPWKQYDAKQKCE